MSPVPGLPPPSVPHVQWPGSFPIGPYCLFTSIHSSPRGYYSILHYVSEGTTPRQGGPSAVSYSLQKRSKKHVNLVRHSSTIVHTVHLYNFTTYFPGNYSIYYISSYTLYKPYMLDVLSIYSVHSAHPIYIYTYTVRTLSILSIYPTRTVYI